MSIYAQGLAVLLITGCGGAPEPMSVETPPSDDGGTVEDLATATSHKDAAAPKDAAAMKDAASVDMACAPVTWYRDHDGDGYGDPSDTMSACAKPSGYVADHTDCDDDHSAIHPTAPELCDLADDDCDGAGDPSACATFAGTYSGSYNIHTVEKLGNTVINEVTCSGTSAVTVDPAASPVVKGTVTCSYGGSLGDFEKTQSGTLEGTLAADGSLSGTLGHKFDGSTAHSFNFTGTLSSGTLTVSGTGTWLPNPSSVQPWDVDFSATAN